MVFTKRKEAINHANESELMSANTLVFIKTWSRGDCGAKASWMSGSFHSVEQRTELLITHQFGGKSRSFIQRGLHLNPRYTIQPALFFMAPQSLTFLSFRLSSAHVGLQWNINEGSADKRSDRPEARVQVSVCIQLYKWMCNRNADWKPF